MIQLIKKVLVHRQMIQAHQSRKADNRKQLNAIYKGLEDRGY